jgi:hypothetical protein
LAIVAATARTFREKHPVSNIAIVSAAEFAEDYIRALSEGVAGAWRERWWDVDLLLLYDAELISGTERAKDELFNILEASTRRGAKIVITADRAPSGIDDIDERLRTRFEMGLVVEATGKSLPKDAGVLNLEEAPPEFIQDDDLWGGFMGLGASDSVSTEEVKVGERVPSLEDFQAQAGVAKVAASPTQVAEAATVVEVAKAEEVAGAPEATEATEAPEAAEAAVTSSAWSPSRENVVWDWRTIEERIVEMTELA